MVLFAATFIGLVKKPKLRYPISIFFLLLAGACSISLMLNDSHHLGMKSITETQTKTLVSTTGKNSPLKLTVYKALGNGKEKVFVAMPSYKTKQKDENGKDIYQDICYPVTKEFREKLYSEIERAYAEAKEKQQEQAKEQSQKQGKEQSQDKDGFMKASGEPLPFR